MDHDEGKIFIPLLGHLSNVFRKLGSDSTINEEDYDDYGCNSSYNRRALGGGSGAIDLSFSVFSMAVITLALLLIVELLIHRLNHTVQNKEFYNEVVNTLYRELATLGIVEFGIFVAHTYLGDKFPQKQEQVFARIHFLLFYTAIINALQSCVLFILSGRHIENMWVRNEKIDENYYVDIRREFDSVERKLDKFHEMRSSSRAEEEFSISRLFGSLKRYLRHPVIVKKYEKLLVPIRFHDMRKHFIDANDLPGKFCLSTYLKSCSLNVSLRLVHISFFAWLALLGFFNFLYFAGGMIEYLGFNFGPLLIWIFILNCIISVFISMVIMQKMKGIFHKIMYWKFIDRKSEKFSIYSGSMLKLNDSNDAGNEKLGFISNKFNHTERDITRRGNTDQIDLFWDSNPPLIIHMSQLIQFLYALSISTVLIFGKEIEQFDLLCVIDVRGEMPMQLNSLLMLICLVSYVFFVIIIARVIPRYILCTSSGQLVDEPRLKECIAKFTLKRALERRQKAPQRALTGSTIDTKKGEAYYAEPHISKELSIESTENQHNKKNDSFGLSHMVKNAQNSSLTTANYAPIPNQNLKPRSNLGGYDSETSSNSDSFRLRNISDLVMMDTKNLPASTSQGKNRKEERRRRRKSVSEGVSAMRKLVQLDDLQSSLQSRKLSTDKGHSNVFLDDMGSGPAKPHRRLRKSVSDNVAAMCSMDTSTGSGGVKLTDEAQMRLKKNESNKNIYFGGTLKSVGGELNAVLEGIPARSVARTAEAFPPTKVADKGVNLKPSSDLSKLDVLSRKFDTQTFVSTDGFDDDDSKSDSEDIPAAELNERKVIEDARKIISWNEKFRTFFVSRTYKFFDGLCGTMLCFWLVGMRTDVLLVASDIVNESENTFDLEVYLAFWWEFGMLSLFVSISIFTFFLFFVFNRGQITSTYCLASFFDVIISSACLFILILSEVHRGPSDKFGHRTSGGVGDIEPFTSLIALRSLRFLLARRISLLVKSYQGRLNNSSTVDGDKHTTLPLQEEKGTVVQLWQKALGLHPDIVEKYGEFSGELLQAMLGITIIKQELKSPDLSQFQDSKAMNVPMQKSEIATGTHASDLDSCSFDHCSGVSPSNQAITTAARNGRKILNKGTSNNLSGDKYLHKSSNESVEMPSVTTGRQLLVGEGPIIQPQVVSISSEEDQENLSMIQHPDEILIRRMRRCERRLPPLLKEWLQVDAVLTKYEIVLLEVCDILNENREGSSDENRLRIIAEENPMRGTPSLEQLNKAHKALVATHGGKGLRLRDVICGRKVVGHLLLSTVDVVKVERHIPRKSQIEPNVVGQTNGLEEYWSPRKSVECKPILSSQRWKHVEEDQFKIHSHGQGFLYLRFFSDLLDYETRALNDGPVVSNPVIPHKNNALLWCQTVVRLRGTSQLKQSLPHFGDNGTDELIDYLEVVDNNKLRHVYARLSQRRASKHINNGLTSEAKTELESSPEPLKIEKDPVVEGDKSAKSMQSSIASVDNDYITRIMLPE